MAPDRCRPAGGRITYLDKQLDVYNLFALCLMSQLDVWQHARKPLLDELSKILLPLAVDDSKLPHLRNQEQKCWHHARSSANNVCPMVAL